MHKRLKKLKKKRDTIKSIRLGRMERKPDWINWSKKLLRFVLITTRYGTNTHKSRMNIGNKSNSSISLNGKEKLKQKKSPIRKDRHAEQSTKRETRSVRKRISSRNTSMK